MTFGPDAIVACPHCGALGRHWTLMSGNTFDTVQWTDGKLFRPMLQHPPGFVRCPGRRGFYWRQDAKPVGAVPNPTFGGLDDEETALVKPEWEAAPSLKEPTESEFHEALDAGAIKPEDELSVRILAWWRGNDRLREREYAGRFGAGRDEPSADPEARRRNLEALLGLLDETEPGGLVMKAETLRELRRFKEALAVLDRVTDEGFSKAVATLRRYCEAGDAELHELNPEEAGDDLVTPTDADFDDADFDNAEFDDAEFDDADFDEN